MTLALPLIIFLVASVVVGWLTLGTSIKRRNPYRVVAGVYGCFFVLLPLLWICSLMPPLNDPNDPEMLGIGGGAYGLQYEIYARCAVLFCSCSLSIALMACWFGRKYVVQDAHVMAKPAHLKYQAISTYGGWLCLGAAILLFIMFFFTFGWGRLWASELFRFETSAGAIALISLRALSVLLLLCGIFSVLCVMAGVNFIGLMAWSLCVIPFMVSASRGFSVLVASLMIAFVLKSSGNLRRFLAVLALVVTAFALLVPLEMRRYNNTGLYYFFASAVGLVNSGPSIVTSISMLFQNLGVGFPIFVEAVSQSDAGVSIWSGIPLQYRILSFSPMPSFVDGFNSSWLQYTPFINRYTPFNAFAELQTLGMVAVFFFFFCHSLLASLIIKLWGRRGLLGPIWNVGLALIVAFTLIQASQYPLRTFVKNTTVLFAMGFLFPYLLDIAYRALGKSRRRGDL